MRFLFIGSRFMLHASFPHSVALMQLRFTSFVVINSRRDLHPQVCAHAGRTKDTKTPLECLVLLDAAGLVTFKSATTLESLLTRAKEQSDLQAAQEMQKAKAALFAMFNRPGRKSQT